MDRVDDAGDIVLRQPLLVSPKASRDGPDACPGRCQVTHHEIARAFERDLRQHLRVLGRLPACRPHAQALLLKLTDRGIRGRLAAVLRLVVPVANDDVFRDQVDSRSRVVAARLPLAVTGALRVDKAVAPDQHFETVFAHDMGVDILDGPREEFGGRDFAAPGTFAQNENFIHAGVKGACAKHVDELVDQVKDKCIDAGMERAPAPAIDVLVAERNVGRLVELRMGVEELKGLPRPGLMAKAVDHRNDLDTILIGQLPQPAAVVGRPAVGFAYFRVRPVFVAVVYLKDDLVETKTWHEARDNVFEVRKLGA